ncbi:hypothetical protein AAVH_35081 [Aphelenchoides avenae]|nr:hypothetical protein AAVH_35081 [Aphelenchus avenae]
MLPNESVLQVPHFADYRTPVLSKRAGRRFLRLGITFAGELARQHCFRVTFNTIYIDYEDLTIGAGRNLQYAHGNHASLAAAFENSPKRSDRTLSPS